MINYPLFGPVTSTLGCSITRYSGTFIYNQGRSQRALASKAPQALDLEPLIAGAIFCVRSLAPDWTIRSATVANGSTLTDLGLDAGWAALGWDEIDAFLHDGDELHAELMEIDENLQRAEYSPAQRAVAIHRRKEIWEAIHPELSADSADKSRGRGRPVSFAKDTQDKTGDDERRTREHLSRAEALGPDLHAVIGTRWVS
ncbi:MAG TPA: hypothetical protein VGC24_00750 [Burkholderiaceae bacterium]